MEYITHTFHNGIRLIHQHTSSPVAHYGIIFNTGSRDEETDEQGMAHFVEHTIFKGTRKRKYFHILSRLENVGGELNAYTTKEEIAIYASFLSQYYERTVELLSDVIANCSFPEHELEKEKEVVIEEINAFKDNISELIFDDFEEMVYNGHPMGRNILGTPENIRKFNRSRVKRFVKNNFSAGQMIICSVGSISGKKIIELSGKYFSEFELSDRKQKRKKFSSYTPRTKKVQKGTCQSHCIIGNEAYHSQHPLRMGTVLLNNILGGQSMNSRLNLSLRERNGIAYNVESGYTAYTDTGILTIYFGTDKKNYQKAIGLIIKEIKKLQNQCLGRLQLGRAKKQLVGQIAMSQENREDLMLMLGKSYLLYDKVDSLEAVYKKIENISALQIMDIANEVLDIKKLSYLVVV